MGAPLLAVHRVLSRYATFLGRASRQEFWWWILAVVVLLLVTRLIDGAMIAPLLGFEAFEEDAGQPLSMLVSLALILPNIAVGVRRLHDTGRTGWWILVGLIPVIGTLVLIFFYLQPGDTDANSFGPSDPLTVTSD